MTSLSLSDGKRRTRTLSWGESPIEFSFLIWNSFVYTVLYSSDMALVFQHLCDGSRRTRTLLWWVTENISISDLEFVFTYNCILRRRRTLCWRLVTEKIFISDLEFVFRYFYFFDISWVFQHFWDGETMIRNLKSTARIFVVFLIGAIGNLFFRTQVQSLPCLAPSLLVVRLDWVKELNALGPLCLWQYYLVFV